MIKYIDKEEDKISISNEMEWTETLRQHDASTLKLYVESALPHLNEEEKQSEMQKGNEGGCPGKNRWRKRHHMRMSNDEEPESSENNHPHCHGGWRRRHHHMYGPHHGFGGHHHGGCGGGFGGWRRRHMFGPHHGGFGGHHGGFGGHHHGGFGGHHHGEIGGGFEGKHHGGCGGWKKHWKRHQHGRFSDQFDDQSSRGCDKFMKDGGCGDGGKENFEQHQVSKCGKWRGEEMSNNCNNEQNDNSEGPHCNRRKNRGGCGGKNKQFKKFRFVKIREKVLFLLSLNCPRKLLKAKRLIHVLLESYPNHAYSYYYLACVESLLNEVEESLVSLKKAVENGFDDLEKLMNDPYLANIRENQCFKEIISNLSNKTKNQSTTGLPSENFDDLMEMKPLNVQQNEDKKC